MENPKIDQCEFKNDKEEALEKYKLTLDFLKFEATMLWQIFGAFFVANTIFIGFILTSIAEGKILNKCIILLVALIGIIITIIWFITFIQNSDWYYFRMWQAKKAEKEYDELCISKKWALLNREGEEFAKGNHIKNLDNEFQMKWISKKIKNRTAGYSLILLILGLYILTIYIAICHN